MMNRIGSALIVGAGIAGLSCAVALARAGVRVTLLDKGRRAGGRVATRHVEGQAFNHGAQFATARGAGFGALLATLVSQQRAAVWTAAGGAGRRIAFVPDMASLPAALAAQAAALGVVVRQERHVAWVHHAGGGYALRHLPAAQIRPGGVTDQGGEVSERHDALLLAMPAPQAQALLSTIGHAYALSAERARLAPCWAVMARFTQAVGGCDVHEDAKGTIAWAARERSRPLVPAADGARPGDAWTLHASAAWSRAHLDDTPQAAARALLENFAALTGAGAPELVMAHRWLYALVEEPLGVPHLWDGTAAVGVCGDWLLGGRIEAAYDSGVSLAEAVSGRAVDATPG
jgi:predicted NAD/FAD-dependent oxidoreductase